MLGTNEQGHWREKLLWNSTTNLLLCRDIFFPFQGIKHPFISVCWVRLIKPRSAKWGCKTKKAKVYGPVTQNAGCTFNDKKYVGRTGELLRDDGIPAGLHGSRERPEADRPLLTRSDTAGLRRFQWHRERKGEGRENGEREADKRQAEHRVPVSTKPSEHQAAG